MHRMRDYREITQMMDRNGTHRDRMPDLKVQEDVPALRIVYLDDNRDDTDRTIELLQSAGIEHGITFVSDRRQFIDALENAEVDLVLSELTMPRLGGMEALLIVREHYSHIPFIVVSGTMGEETAIDAIVRGARDFVSKRRLQRLVPALKRVIQEKREASERAEAEMEIMALHRLASRISDIVARSPVVAFSWLLEPGWPVSFVSDNVAQFGYNPDDFLRSGLLYAAIIHPDDIPWIVEEVEAFRLRDETEIVLEYRILKKNGASVWVEAHLTVLKDAENTFLTADGVIIDITERKLREIETELSRARLEELYQLASIDCDDEAVLIDQVLARAVAITSSDVGYVHFLSGDQATITRSFSSGTMTTRHGLAASNDFMSENGACWAECLQQREPIIHNECEVSHRALSETGGDALVGRCTAVPIIIEGKVVMLAGVGNKADPYDEGDVRVLQLMMIKLWGKRKHLREAIELKNLWRAVEQSPVSIVVTDTTGHIEYSNPMMHELTGYTSDEAAGKSMEVLQSGETPVEVYEELRSTILEGRDWKGTLKSRKKDGQLYWESVSISPVTDQKGAIVNYVVVAEDVSERIATEQALIAARKEAERASKLKDCFIAMISHEIRTPLNVIFGYSGLIKQLYGERIDENDLFMFEAIEDAGNRLMRTVDQIIAASVLGTGSYTPAIETVDVTVALQDMLKTYRQTANGKGLTLELIPQEDMPMVRVDRFGFEQTMHNLIDNALKFTTVGGVCIRSSVDADLLRVDIHDTGKGMSRDYISVAFSAFTQEIEGYSRPYEGLGLGLTLVRNYVEINHGSVTIESEPDNGSVFSVYFPLSP